MLVLVVYIFAIDHHVDGSCNLENFPFTETEGLKVRMNNQSTIDFVKLYLTDEVFYYLSNRNK